MEIHGDLGSTAPTANERVLRASRLFSSLDPELTDGFARVASRTRYARGEYIWRAGESAAHFAIIANGLVKIARAAADGSETILALFGPRRVSAMWPSSAASRTRPTRSPDGGQILRVEAKTVRSAFAANPALLGAMNASLIEHVQALQEKIVIMSAGKIDKRLATLLLHLASRFGDEQGDGTTFLPIHLSRVECARLIGATIETTIRTFSKWQKTGLVERLPRASRCVTSMG